MKRFFTLVVLGTITLTAVLFLPQLHSAKADNSNLQQQIDGYNQKITDLNKQIADYQAKLQQIGADKKTLQAAINALNLQRKQVETQISATQNQINITKLQIQQLSAQISDTEQNISSNQTVLAAYLRDLQLVENQPLIVEVFSSVNLADIWNSMNSNLQMQGSIQKKVLSLQNQKIALADLQTQMQDKQATLTTQKQSLDSQQQSLIATKNTKNQLLAQTKSQESAYQKLLAEAQAQLKSFQNFVKNAGGANLLSNQTVCDAWGCYYNQRDSIWGAMALNGTLYTLANAGCLVTSMAMIMTHYGYRDVTPVSINSNPNNFASYFPAYLLFTIAVDGVTATRKAATIDATLAGGDPVVIGMNVYGGTHFIVLVSGRGGNYVMRDPYFENAKDLPFSSRYNLKEVFSIAKVVIE